MKLYKYLLIVSLPAFMFLTSCKDAGVITELEGINVNVANTFAVANSKNSLSVGVKAESLSEAKEYSVVFDKTELEIAIAISKLVSGSVSIQIYNDTKQLLYSNDYTSATASAETIYLSETPTKVKFIFNSLSAEFSCALTVK